MSVAQKVCHSGKSEMIGLGSNVANDPVPTESWVRRR